MNIILTYLVDCEEVQITVHDVFVNTIWKDKNIHGTLEMKIMNVMVYVAFYVKLRLDNKEIRLEQK